jgi:large subunit ribosomal protein L25
MATTERPQLHAEPRERTGRKSDLRALRESGKIPGSLFGHGDPESITLPAREISDFLHHHTTGALLDVVVNGRAIPVLIREVDRNPRTGRIITLGLQRVNLTETVKAIVPITFTGEEELIKDDLVFQSQMDSLEVHARADQLPEAIVVDISQAKAGDMIRVGDLPLPEGVEATRDAEQVVASITTPTVPSDVAAALDAEAAEHEAEKAAHAEAEVEAAAEEEATG